MNLMLGDCIERMKEIPDASVDMILADPPYGTTACKWDSVIPLASMWEQLERVIKLNGAVVIFGCEPFSSALRMSNLNNFKYDWVWNKTQARGHLNAYRRPMVKHELVSVFNCKTYYPIIEDKPTKDIRPHSKSGQAGVYSGFGSDQSKNRKLPVDKKLPTSVLLFSNAQKTVHPTQKPVDLCEYLIKTYTVECETVLDFAMGSGTTGVACKNLNREFIGIEKDEKYFEIARARIEAA